MTKASTHKRRRRRTPPSASPATTTALLRTEVQQLRARLADADEVVRSIRAGEVDALVLHGAAGEQIFTLKGAERSYRVLVETMSEGAATLGADGVILYCNGYFSFMVGRPLEQVMGSSIDDVVAPQDRDAFRALMLRGRTQAAKGEITFGAQPREGASRAVPAYVSLSPLLGEDGASFLCLVATDLSAQKRSDEMLANERLATSVIEEASDAILVCDIDERVVKASKGVRAFSKRRPAFASLFAELFPHDGLQALLAAALLGRSSRGVSASLLPESGESTDVLASGAPLFGQHENVVGAIVTITDVSDLKKTQTRLESAVKARDDFLLIASHELRTPLMSMQMQLAGLLRQWERKVPLPHAQWGKSLTVAARQARHLGKLTDALLDVSQLKTGRFELELDELDLTRALRDAVDAAAPEARSSGCHLRFHGKAAAMGQWDKLRIEQALGNLLSNAFKYAPGKPVDVSVVVSDGAVVVEVEDRGFGIAVEDHERIFRQFERAVPTAHYGGLGLGLFITQRIVEAAGGSIRVQSEPGGGAIFRVRLPIRTVKTPANTDDDVRAGAA